MRLSTGLFLALTAGVASTRLIELRLSRRHRQALLRHGAAPAPDPAFPAMAALHIAAFSGSALEVLLLRRPFRPKLAAASFVSLASAMLLRLWVIRTLGRHWNVRVVNSTGLGVVTTGPYRWIRHPNYVAVFVELLSLPLLHSAWLTATVCAAAHLLVLSRRVQSEEAVLLAEPAYAAAMDDKPRFIPRPWSHV